MNSLAYMLITPARNEEAFIEKTLQAVTAQTLLPRKWVIVSDGSTDRTDEIVREFVKQYEFIQLLRTTGHQQRTFISKVRAFNAGYEQHVKGLDYAFVGMLDADVSFAPDYYERVLEKFLHNEKLGIAGGIRYDWCDGKFRKVLCAKNSVGGPFQLFRRPCFEAIGGFIPIEGGGEDAAAEIMARMHGWEVESFSDIAVYHHRCTGTASGNKLRVPFRDGIKNYLLGYHPLFHLAKCIFRLREKPYLVGSVLSMFGYLFARVKKYKKPVSEAFVSYARSEQLARLRTLLGRGHDPAFRS